MPTPSDDFEDEYVGECYYARHPEDIQPELSLDTIHWQAPMPEKRALPSTFAEAELEALAPRKPHPPGEECISDYFVASKQEEALLSVRQTDAWDEVKDDITFRDFADVPPTIVPKSLLGKYIYRTDSTWTMPAQDMTPEPEPTRRKSEVNSDTSGGAMEIDSRQSPKSQGRSDDVSEQEDVLGGLEQALQQNGTTNGSRRHSHASSTASVVSQKISRPKPLPPVRDQAQEDILAQLGVTGSPKMVYQTPGPAFGARTSRQNSINSNPSGFPVPPPPRGRPPPRPQQRSYSYNPWITDGQPHRNGYDAERPRSSASQHTAVGSDFQADDQDATPRPKSAHRIDSRKRGYQDDSDDAPGEYTKRENDETPKQRRKQPRVHDVYR